MIVWPVRGGTGAEIDVDVEVSRKGSMGNCLSLVKFAV